MFIWLPLQKDIYFTAKVPTFRYFCHKNKYNIYLLEVLHFWFARPIFTYASRFNFIWVCVLIYMFRTCIYRICRARFSTRFYIGSKHESWRERGFLFCIVCKGNTVSFDSYLTIYTHVSKVNTFSFVTCSYKLRARIQIVHNTPCVQCLRILHP